MHSSMRTSTEPFAAALAVFPDNSENGRNSIILSIGDRDSVSLFLTWSEFTQLAEWMSSAAKMRHELQGRVDAVGHLLTVDTITSPRADL